MNAHTPEVVAVLRKALARSGGVPDFELRLEDGSSYRFGSSDGNGWSPRFTITAVNPRGVAALASLDEMRVGEAYLQGDLEADGDFLALLDLRRILSGRHVVHSMLRFVVPLLTGQRRSDARWISQHYDLGNELYFNFLDRWAHLYSQALYVADDEPLEEAVRHKFDYIIEACRLTEGAHVLDVGAGWGSFARYAADKGINVTMLTLSREQYTHLSDWIARQKLPCRLTVKLESIFDHGSQEPYDAIVGLGVMEHIPDYRKLFARVEQLIKPTGLLYLDFAAGRRKFDVSTFVYRHVFPGNHCPVYLPGLLDAANRTRFEPIALHNDRHSYYLTLKAWASNLDAARDRIVSRFGESVYRLYRLYLWGGANLFGREGLLESYRVVFQKSVGLSSAVIGPDRAV